jgi:hypothetical protein
MLCESPRPAVVAVMMPVRGRRIAATLAESGSIHARNHLVGAKSDLIWADFPFLERGEAFLTTGRVMVDHTSELHTGGV